MSWIDESGGELESLVFTPDGSQLISGGNITVPREKFGRPYRYRQADVVQQRVWDVASGKLVRELATPRPEVGSGALALSRDGRTLAAGYEFKILIWDFAAARVRRSIDVPPRWRGGRGLAISADGRMVCAPLGSHAIRLWSTTTGELLSPKSDSHTSTVLAIAYADGGRLIVTAGDDATVRSWNAADGRQRWAKVFDGTAYVDVMAVSPDGALIAAAGSADVPHAGVRILKTTTGEEVRFIPMSEKRFRRDVHALAFSPDSHVLAIEHDRLKESDSDIDLYDVATGKKRAGISPERMLAYPWAMAFSPDGTSLCTVHTNHDNGAVNILDTASGQRRRQFTALKLPPDAANKTPKQPQLSHAAFARDLKTLITSQGAACLCGTSSAANLLTPFPRRAPIKAGILPFPTMAGCWPWSTGISPAPTRCASST